MTSSLKEQFWAPRRLGHANLFVGSYESAADYYRDVVGFREVYRQPNNMATFVSNGNTYHDLGLTDVRSRYGKAGQTPGLWHLAFEVENEVDLVDGYNRAIAAGVQFTSTEDHDVAHSLYFIDPDGNLVEVYADVMDDWRSQRKGIINKEKPKYIPGVTSQPVAEKLYPKNPHIDRIEDAVFHPKKVTHVALVTAKFDQMLDFYTGIIGLRRLAVSGGSYAVLRGTVGEGDLTLYRQRRGLEPGLHHVGFEVSDETDLEHSLARLSHKGIRAERSVDHPARKSVTIVDPDGIRLQFFVNRKWTPDAIASLDEATALYLL
jgi:catechol 2,3-dioxygenase